MPGIRGRHHTTSIAYFQLSALAYSLPISSIRQWQAVTPSQGPVAARVEMISQLT
jgi:hypothetical protein